MADWDEPTITRVYTSVLSDLKGRDEDQAVMFDIATPNGIPTNTIRWDSAASNWKKWNGSTWGELDTDYEINVATVGGFADTAFLKLAGAGTQTITSGKLVIDLSTGALLDLDGSGADEAYIQFYPDIGAPASRRGYFGFFGAATEDLTLINEYTNGDIKLTTNGTGSVDVTGDFSVTGDITGDITGNGTVSLTRVSAGFTGNILTLTNDHSSSTGTCLHIQSDGTGEGIYIDHSNVAGYAIDILSSTARTSANLLRIRQTNASATSTVVALSAAAGSADCLLVTNSGSGDGIVCSSSTGYGINVTNGGIFTSEVIFPASSSLSTDANTLDDYSEEAFTATLTATGGTITLSSGENTLMVTKIGSLVHLMGYLLVSSVSSPTGACLFGLPYTSAVSRVGAGGSGRGIEAYTPVLMEGLSTLADGTYFIQHGTAGSSLATLQTHGDTSIADEFIANTEIHVNLWYTTDD